MNYDQLSRLAADLLHTNQTALQAMWRAWNASVEAGAAAKDQGAPAKQAAEINIVLRESPSTHAERVGNLVPHASDDGSSRAMPTGIPMYNLQKAKEEIDIVAKHTGVLTEHVIAISDRLQALESSLATKLHDLKTLIGGMEGRFTELHGSFVGGEAHSFETTAISDLGAKLALLRPATPGQPAAHSDPYHAEPHHAEPPHEHVEHHPQPEFHEQHVDQGGHVDHHPEHQDQQHGGDYRHG